MHTAGAPRHWWLVALATTGWSAAHLAGHGTLGVALPLLVGTGALAIWRLPVLACLLVCGAQTVALLSDIPPTSPAGLAPGLVCLTVLGLSRRPRVALPLISLFLAIIVATGLPWPRTVVGVVLFLTTWALADQVRRRQQRLHASRRRAARLAAEDARQLADRVAARERRLLLARSAQVVRTALAEVRSTAALASRDLDPVLVDRVRERAVDGIDELRELLDLLKDESTEPAPDRSAGPGDDQRLASRVTTASRDVAVAVGVALVGLVDLHVGDLEPAPATIALGAALAGSLTLRRTSPALATCVAALAMACAAAFGAPSSHGLAETLVLALLSWTVVGRGGRAGAVGWVALLVATVAVAAQRGVGYPEVAGSLMVVVAITARVRVRVLADQARVACRVADLEAATESVVREALEAGRTRLAADLHDVVGHALGVMVVQAGAAAMTLEHDPTAARASLSHLAGCGDEALAELDALAVGGELPESFGAATAALVDRIRSAGIPVQVNGTLDLPAGPAATVLHRVVQEALTNAVKHAPGARVRLGLAQDETGAHVEVSNEPPSTPGRAPGTRAGLAGLAGRVAATGGVLEAGHRPDGGFRVRASVPLAVAVSTLEQPRQEPAR